MFNKNSSQDITAKDNSRDKLSFIILLGLVLLLPVFFIPVATFSFLFSKTVLISLVTIVLSLVWIISRLKDGIFTTTKNKILLLAIAIPIVYLLSSFFSGSVMVSLVGQGYEVGTVIFTVILFVLLFLTTSILNTKEKIYNVFFVFFISFVILSLYQILRLVFGAEFLSFGVLTSSNSSLVGKWNELAIFYGLTTILSLLIVEFIDQSRLIKTLGYITLIVSLFFISLVNLSLVWGVIGLFAFLLISYIFLSNRTKAKEGGSTKKNFPIMSLLVVILAIVIFVGNISGNGNKVGGVLSSVFSITNTEVRPSWQGTYDITKNTLASKQVLLGAGPNKFVNQWLLYKPVEINNTVFWNTDFNTGVSYLFTSVVSVGVLGILLWLAFLMSLLFVGFKAMFTFSGNKIDNYLLPFSFLTTLYLWIFSLLYVPSHAIMALTFIFTGALISLLIQNNLIKTKKVSFAENQKVDFILVLVLIFLVLISIVGAYTISQKFIADIYSRKSLVELNNEGGLSKTEEGIMKAIKISGNDSYYRFLSEINLVQLQGLLQEEDMSEEELRNQFQVILGTAVANGRKATEIDPENYQNWVTLGRVYETVILFGIEGAYDQAINSYVRAVNLNPQNPQLFFTLGVLDYSQENYENAKIVLERAVILRPAYSDAKYFLGLTYNKLGRTDDAVTQFEDVKYLNPESKEVDIILSNLEKGKDPLVGLKKINTPVKQAE